MWIVLSVNVLFLALLGAIWSKDNFTNISIKLLAWLLAASNLFLILQQSGYIVRLH